MGPAAASTINKTMSRDDLLTAEARPVVAELNALIRAMKERGLCATSWYGTLPRPARSGLPALAERLGLRRPKERLGRDNRAPGYTPLPDAADDARSPWFLYWEIYWVLRHGPRLTPEMRLLDAGGTASLFTCCLAARGHEVHSVDLNPRLVAHGEKLSQGMGWRMHSYAMDMSRLAFPDGSFDHAYSICVFEHLGGPLKQAALREIARCLKPGGTLSVTFDYRNPAPVVAGRPDARPENQLGTPADVQRCFLGSGVFDLLGNRDFADSGESYLVNPAHGCAPYTFGALFLRKKAGGG